MLIVSTRDLDRLTRELVETRSRLLTTQGLRATWDPEDETRRARALVLGALCAYTDGAQILEEGSQLMHGFGADGAVCFPPQPVRFPKGGNDVPSLR